MTARDKATIKTFFETGDKPNQSQFQDLIDSYVDKAGPIGTLEVACSGLGSGPVVVSAGVPSIGTYAGLITNMGLTVYTTAGTTSVIEGLVATTAVAIAGSDNTTLMTPQLVKQSGNLSELVLLATAAASSSSTLDFTSKIDHTIYSHYKIVFIDLLTSTTATVGLAAAIDNATFTLGWNYQVAKNPVSGSSAATLTGASGGTPVPIIGSLSGGYCNGWIDITPSITGGYTSAMAYMSNDAGQQFFTTTLQAVGAVNALRFLPSAGNFTSGKIYLYGVKNT